MNAVAVTRSALTAVPQPMLMSQLSGPAFKLVRDWDFGVTGNIRNRVDLARNFDFHDHWGTIANGTNYGAVTASPYAAHAIAASGLGLPNDRQPIEDAARPTWEWTASTMRSHVWPLARAQTTVSAAKHNATNGSLTSKYGLPRGGSRLGRELLWETRVRIPKPVRGYWFALWTAGKRWSNGAEMDVVESFGTEWVTGNAFHSGSIGGVDHIDYADWFAALDRVGVPSGSRALSDWHVWTWVYRKDDTYEVYVDTTRVQHGTLKWTEGGSARGLPIEMFFLFDFSWGHTQVWEVNVDLPASAFPVTYEIDYSRVYVR